MSRKKAKTREAGNYTLVLPKDLVEGVDEIAAELDRSRSGFVADVLEMALADWKFMKRFGLTPNRVKALSRVLDSLGLKPEKDSEWENQIGDEK